MGYEQDLNLALELAKRIFKTPVSMNYWFNQPNENFFNQSPMTMILSGQGDHIIKYLSNLESLSQSK